MASWFAVRLQSVCSPFARNYVSRLPPDGPTSLYWQRAYVHPLMGETWKIRVPFIDCHDTVRAYDGPRICMPQIVLRQCARIGRLVH